MPPYSIAKLSAGVAVVAWTAKVIVIAAAGGLSKSPMEGPLFVLGMLAFVVACAALGVAVSADRSVAWRVGAAVVLVLLGILISMVLQALLNAVLPDAMGWLRNETGLWVSAVGLLAVVVAAARPWTGAQDAPA
jgi:hypothetical protein